MSSNTVDRATKITLETIDVWKGEPYETMIVNTGRGGGDCGITAMGTGSEWLVYAYGEQEFLRSNICERTRPLAGASEDLTVLGVGNAPILSGANEPLP